MRRKVSILLVIIMVLSTSVMLCGCEPEPKKWWEDVDAISVEFSVDFSTRKSMVIKGRDTKNRISFVRPYTYGDMQIDIKTFVNDVRIYTAGFKIVSEEKYNKENDCYEPAIAIKKYGHYKITYELYRNPDFVNEEFIREYIVFVFVNSDGPS